MMVLAYDVSYGRFAVNGLLGPRGPQRIARVCAVWCGERVGQRSFVDGFGGNVVGGLP
jgi:hypothetical protein